MSEICAAMGRKLTRARRRRKLSLHDVAEELCISPYYLKALESGHLGKLPGPVYALGFLRNYADLVGLNADELASMVKDYLADEEAAQPPHLPEPHRESRFPARLVLVGATSAMLLFFTAWPMIDSQGSSEAGMVPVMPAHLADRLQQPSEATAEAAQTAVAKPDRDGDLLSGSRQQFLTAGPPEAQRQEILGQEAGQAVGEFEPAQADFEATVEIRATRDTWVVIRNENDQTLLSGIIRSGDSFVPKSTARLKLTASDGGSLVLYVRGRPVAELGRPGHALRSFELDVAGLINGTS